MPDEKVETEEEVKEEVVEEKQEVVVDELSEVQQLAKEIGWNPNHEGGDREFKTAEEYIRGSKDIQTTQTKQNKNLKREIEEMKKGVNMLQQHNDTIYKLQVKALKSRGKDLQAKRVEALEDSDAEAVSEIDKQLRDINDIPEELPVEQIQTTPPEFQEWAEKNEWYGKDEKMAAYADAIGKTPDFQALATADFPRFLKKVTKKVKEEFPEKFPKPQQRTTTVESSSQRRTVTGAKSQYSYKDLSRSQQDICDQLVKTGIMTEEKYIEQLETIEKNQGRV